MTTSSLGGLRLAGALLCALAACGDDDASPSDGMADVAPDTGTQVETDATATPDVAPDTNVDVATETAAETIDDTVVAPDTDDVTATDALGDATAETIEEVAPDVLEEVTADVLEEVTADVLEEVAPDTTPDTSDPVDVVAEVTDVALDTTPSDPCDDEPPAPLQYETLTGFTGGEDFAFYSSWAYSVDQNGNLVRDASNGQGQLVLPGLSTFAAGMALLPDGRLAVNDAADGALVLVNIAPPAGQQVSRVTILGGLSYPNGLDVDDEGFLYLAEQDAGRVRRVDPADGSYEIIANDLYNPNGVSFAPGFRRLYVGSFGGGVVYALDRAPDDSWGAPYTYISLPGFGDPSTPINSCKGGRTGDWCYTSSGFGGQCGEELQNSQLQCIADPAGIDPLVEICRELGLDKPCSIKIGGVVYGGTCAPDPFGADVVCAIEQSIAQPCFHSAPGKSCVSFQFGAPFFGVCTDAANIPPGSGFPPSGLFCVQPGGGEGGGLDGLNVDACGTVYVTEYILGNIWRKREGGPPEIAVTLPSQWIPNMKWGSGVGGWSSTRLYVADRDEGRMFGLDIGREGKHSVPSP